MHKTYQILQWTQKLSGNNAHQQMQRKTAKPKATKKILKKLACTIMQCWSSDYYIIEDWNIPIMISA